MVMKENIWVKFELDDVVYVGRTYTEEGVKKVICVGECLESGRTISKSFIYKDIYKTKM